MTTEGRVFRPCGCGHIEARKVTKNKGPENGPDFEDVEPLRTVRNGSTSSKDRPHSELNY